MGKRWYCTDIVCAAGKAKVPYIHPLYGREGDCIAKTDNASTEGECAVDTAMAQQRRYRQYASERQVEQEETQDVLKHKKF